MIGKKSGDIVMTVVTTLIVGQVMIVVTLETREKKFKDEKEPKKNKKGKKKMI